MRNPSPPPPPGTHETLQTLLAFDTRPRGGAHLACARWLVERLEALGFTAQFHPAPEHAPPLIEAHRPARGLSGHLVLYGHYDVEALDTDGPVFPARLEEREGRWFGRGVADNKGPLAARLSALARWTGPTPALTWFIQGEEETGSGVARQVFRERLPHLAADLWLDETGYHDHPAGTLRLIARQLGPGSARTQPPDAALHGVLEDLRRLAERWEIGSRLEVRGLNKGSVAGGCPFHEWLPVGARYLALGINDSQAHIHGPGESVPLWTFALHAEQFPVLFQGVDRLARGPR